MTGFQAGLEFKDFVFGPDIAAAKKNGMKLLKIRIAFRFFEQGEGLALLGVAMGRMLAENFENASGVNMSDAVDDKRAHRSGWT
jgi:hypothetical protein